MFIDAILLLGKSDIMEDNYISLEQEIMNILWILFKHFLHFKHHILQRIDYRYDVVVEENSTEIYCSTCIRSLLNHIGIKKVYR